MTVSAFKSDFRNLSFLSDPAVNKLQQKQHAQAVDILYFFLHDSLQCMHSVILLWQIYLSVWVI